MTDNQLKKYLSAIIAESLFNCTQLLAHYMDFPEEIGLRISEWGDFDNTVYSLIEKDLKELKKVKEKWIKKEIKKLKKNIKLILKYNINE